MYYCLVFLLRIFLVIFLIFCNFSSADVVIVECQLPPSANLASGIYKKNDGEIFPMTRIKAGSTVTLTCRDGRGVIGGANVSVCDGNTGSWTPPLGTCISREAYGVRQPAAAGTTTRGHSQSICNGFRCANGNCIPRAYVCDSDNDCRDNSDERNCPPRTSPRPCDAFQCPGGGRCIPTTWLCDGDDDCDDKSDEKDCGSPNLQCNVTSQFRCLDGEKCIPEYWHCDGGADCKDESDEVDCINYICSSGRFKCADQTKCIANVWLCDGDSDCDDGSDEQNCGAETSSRSTRTTSPTITTTKTKAAPSSTTTLNLNNGIAKPCPSDRFKCATGDGCIIQDWRCDGGSDCDDHSDEMDCETYSCTSNQVKCNDGKKCILKRWVCDGDSDCSDGGDEQNCPMSTQCPGFVCGNGHCIPRRYVCDGDRDCVDGTDERNCPSSSTTASTNNCRGFTCRNGKCIPSSYVCDFDDDCNDNSDEQNCTAKKTTASPCHGFSCANGKCIIASFVCDSENDCGDNSDERNCQHPGTTPSSSLLITSYNDCGVARPTPRIYGGANPPMGEYPWVAKLYSKFEGDSSSYGCDAALISDQWILTAAHCVTHKTSIENVKALLGRYNLSSARTENGLEMRSTQVITHPNYDQASDWNYDYALIKLTSPVTFRKNIRPICLPDAICNSNSPYSSTTIDSCSELIVAGWGRTEAEASPVVLRMGKMSIRPRSVCNDVFRSTLTEAQVCAGRGETSTCRGDSGGPVMCSVNNRLYAFGVISWGGSGCGTPGVPSVFSRVCHVLDWIRETIS